MVNNEKAEEKVNNKVAEEKAEEKATDIEKEEDVAEEKEVQVDIGESPCEGTEVEITEVENVPEEKKEAAKPKPVPKGSRRGSKALQIELEKAQELAKGNEDKYKRLLAEFENARQRTEKEGRRMFDVGAKDVLEKLLPVIDNFERAIASIPEEDKERAFEQGIDKIYRQFIVTLEEIGVAPMDAEGKEFNPDLHNAVIHVEDENFGENVVVEEMQKGYMYKDQVLRHSMVKVAN